ncbi:hypothetical protein [Thiomicrospira sp. ALE5]|uniref:hypothetical protein n=1 Tax=Thiomicrospira sp. ALE5 TaxID=748650 RepID=UPI0008E2E305|nr:hypothetical protein [Thiomicrospira sp. ALE5]SFR52658.1 hypothetical protein SAMN03092900_0726 [Thiomicrospira sp. ALE5]
MSIETVKNEVNDFLRNVPFVDEKIASNIKNLALKEVALNKDIGYIPLDKNNCTPVARENILTVITDKIFTFENDYKRVKGKLKQKIENLESHDFDKEFFDVNEKKEALINKKVKELKDDKNYQATKKSYEDNLDFYEKMKLENNNKPPKKHATFLYIIGIVFVGTAEWFINYPTFSEKYVPFVAMAFTLLAAAIFAASSHYHGEFFRQLPLRISSKQNRNERRYDLLWIVIITISLVGVLWWVSAARYAMLYEEYRPLIESDAAFLIGGVDSVNAYKSELNSLVFQTVFANVLVWFVGVIWSYLIHDKVPNYQSVYSSYLKATAEFNKKENQIRKELISTGLEFDGELEKIEKRRIEIKSQINVLKDLEDNIDHHFNSTKALLLTKLENLLVMYRMELCQVSLNNGIDKIGSFSTKDYANL